MEIELAVEPEARAIAVAQAAEKVYRSTGADAGVDISLSVDDAGWLEWLPQETILFDGARLVRRTRIDVVPTGRLLAGECLVFGRVARGEQFRRGRLRESWEVRRSSRLVWADRFHLEDDIDRVLATPAGLAGARAYATAIYVSPDAADFLEPARGWAAHDGVRAGVTCIDRVLITRWLGWDAALVRGAFETFWSEIRCAAGGLPKCLPRLWHI